MAGSVNKVILIGRLGRDPETITFQNGGKQVKFPLATEESWKDKNSGEKKKRTDWHNVVVNAPGLVDLVEQYVRKGSLVYLEGKMITRNYEKDGQKHYVTEVVIASFHGTMTMLPSGKADNNTGAAATSAQATASAPAQNTQQQSAATAGGGGDDSIPF